MDKNLSSTIEQINTFVRVLPVIMLVETGIFLTLKSMGLPIRKFGLAMRYVLHGARTKHLSKEHAGDILPFQILAIKMGSILDTENIVDMAAANPIGSVAHSSGWGFPPFF